MQRRHNLLMLHLQQDFGQSGDSVADSQCPDIRFGRSDQAKLRLLRMVLEGLAEGLQSSIGSPKLCTRAVGLNVTDVPRIGFGILPGPADHTALCPVGSGLSSHWPCRHGLSALPRMIP